MFFLGGGARAVLFRLAEIFFRQTKNFKGQQHFKSSKIQVKVKIVTIQHPEFNAKHVNL